MALVHVDDGTIPEAAAPAPAPARAKVVPAPASEPGPVEPLPAAREPLTREPVARERLRINAVRMPSVVRISLLLSAAVATAVMVASVLVWWLARMAGVLGSFESFVAGALGLEAFSIPGGGVLLVWTGIVALFTIAGIAVSVLGAILYNRVAEVVGGLEVEATVRPSPRTRP